MKCDNCKKHDDCDTGSGLVWPSKSDYVNNHPYCLHLWRPVGKEISRPPAIFVGVNPDKKDFAEQLRSYLMDKKSSPSLTKEG